MAFDSMKSINSNEMLTYYLSVNMNNICRICLEKGPKLMPIFDPVKPPHFSVLIMACSSVQVIEGDGLPPYICQKCISKLNIAFQFKTQCESSESKLRQCFEHFTHIPTTPDLSGFIEIKKVEHHCGTTNGEGGDNMLCAQEIVACNSDNQISDDTSEDATMIQTLGHVELEASTIQTVNKNNFGVMNMDLDDLKLKNETNLNQPDIVGNTLGEGFNRKQRQFKDHQCDTCGKVFRTKPSLIHHIRIHTGERPYVCHLCDKRFINGGHLHTHMKTHTGEKNHVCAACNKAFTTTQQLTKHTIAIHTSERPYACTYCPKRFASSSNLNAHTKVHTGEKNYHCDQCGKAFSTKAQLYQHMLIHTGEKAFLCEYCHKRFTQKAHLIRHLRTHKS